MRVCLQMGSVPSQASPSVPTAAILSFHPPSQPIRLQDAIDCGGRAAVNVIVCSDWQSAADSPSPFTEGDRQSASVNLIGRQCPWWSVGVRANDGQEHKGTASQTMNALWEGVLGH